MSRTQQQQQQQQSSSTFRSLIAMASVAMVVMAGTSGVDAFIMTPSTSFSRPSSTFMTRNMAVVDIDGEAAFDKTIQSAGNSLVVVDYSTTW
jgi:hypothetical protein